MVFAVGGGSVIGSIFRQIEQAKLKSDIPCKCDCLPLACLGPRISSSLPVPGISFFEPRMRYHSKNKKLTQTTGSFKALEDWTLVDLTLGVIAASLPVLSAIIPAKWKSLHTSSTYKLPSQVGSHPLSNPGHYARSRFQGKNGKESKTGISRCAKGVHGDTFGESEENIVRTDVIELSFQSKGDLERGEGMDYKEECEGCESGDSGSGSGSGKGRESRSGSRCGNGNGNGNGEGSSAGERLKRSFSKNRSRGNSTDRGLDKGTSEWHGGKGQYGNKVEIGRDE